ncbi:MAG: BGTF surface domain-containing protein [Halosimplex sp.]
MNNTQFTVYVREAGTGDFNEYNASGNTSKADVYDLPAGAVNTNATGDAVIITGDYNSDFWGDLSPADEVKVHVGSPSGIASSANTSRYVDLGNFTVETASGALDQSTADHNTRSSAQRIYQGQDVRFVANHRDTDILLTNVETGEILLDGGTGSSSSIVFDTSNLESGTTYRLTFNEGNDPAEGPVRKKFFNVTSLRMSASLDEDGTLFEHNEDVNLSVSGEAIRGNSPVAITVDGPSMRYAQTSFDNRGEFSQDLSYGAGNLDAGDYTVVVTDVATGAEITAGEFSVDAFPSASSASFDGGVFEEQRGDVVEIPISLDDSEEGAQATVQVGSVGKTNYVTNVTVADEDGDGEVTLMWNTYMAGTGVRDRVFTAEGADNVTAWGGEHGGFVDAVRVYPGNSTAAPNASSVKFAGNGILDPASYDLAVVANNENQSAQINNGNFSFADVDADAVGAVSINARSTESSNVWVVPSDKKDQVDFGFIDENTDGNEDPIDGNLTQSDLVASDELIVHQVSASGLEGVFKNRTESGDNETNAFLGAVDSGVFNASFSEQNPGPNAQRENFNLDTSNTVVIPDYQNDTYYIAVDLSGVSDDVLQDNIVYNASFTFESYSSVGPQIGGEGSGTVGSEWTYEKADATLDTNAEDMVIIRNQAGQTIRGDTNVAPGTELGLRINSQSDDSPFLKTLTTHVQEDRSFAATGDFSDKGANINFTVSVRRGGKAITENAYDGRILGQPTASVTFSDQMVSESNQQVVVDSVTLSDGGFVAIHEGSASGDVIGTSKYLQAGQHTDVRIALDSDVNDTTTLVAMPHLDTNANNLYDFPEADAPYTADGSAVTDSASVSLNVETPTPTATPSPTPTATPSPTPTATPSPTPTATPSPTPTATPSPTATPEEGGNGGNETPTPTTSDGGPGFGVAVSLIALLAAALLAARRRE